MIFVTRSGRICIESAYSTQRNFFAIFLDQGLRMVLESPFFTTQEKTLDPGLRKVLECPFFTTQEKTSDPGLIKV